MTFTRETAARWGSIGGLTTAARGTGDYATGRAAAAAKLEAMPNPEAARRLHFARMRIASAEARRAGSRHLVALPTPISRAPSQRAQGAQRGRFRPLDIGAQGPQTAA